MSTTGPTASTHTSHTSRATYKKKQKGRTFQCTGFPDCTMTFTRSEHLARHIRKHTGERLFQCPYCARKFSRLDNLRQHKQTVHAHEQVAVVIGNNEEQQQQPYQHLQHQNKEQPQQQSRTNSPLNESETSDDDEENTKSTQQRQQRQEQPTLLSKPTQFKPKHRPLPLSLAPRPSSFSSFNSSPFNHTTTFTQQATTSDLRGSSSSGKNFVLSPVPSPLYGTFLSSLPPQNIPLHQHQHQHQQQQVQQVQQQPLPSVQFLSISTNGNSDGLLSPYDLSFSSTQSHNNTSSLTANYIPPLPPQPQNTNSEKSRNTPISTAFEQSLTYNPRQFGESDFKTPTTTYFDASSGRPSLHHPPSSSSSSSTSSSSTIPTFTSSRGSSHRKSWLNNVLNSSSSSSSSVTSLISVSTQGTDYNGMMNNVSPLSMNHNRKLRIESLLNEGQQQRQQQQQAAAQGSHSFDVVLNQNINGQEGFQRQ